MTNTTTSVTTVETTERTAEDIINDLHNSRYITKSNKFLVTNTWGTALKVVNNPLNTSRKQDVILEEKDLKELLHLHKLISATNKARSANWDLEDATYELTNTEGKRNEF